MPFERTEAFALIGGTIDEDLAADHIPKGQKHLHQFSIAKFLGQMVDEQVAPLGAGDGAAWEHQKIFKELTNLPLNTNIVNDTKYYKESNGMLIHIDTLDMKDNTTFTRRIV